MKWYLAKLVYRIICGEGNHKPQFDEQLRLIHAEDDLYAFQKARTTGHQEEDTFLNNAQKLVHWKFIDVPELHPLNELTDSAELYSRICEEDDADNYIKITYKRAAYLLENSTYQGVSF
ncbi:MAG: DUF4288 domain-containing protein [Ginsengibacter sp.]